MIDGRCGAADSTFFMLLGFSKNASPLSRTSTALPRSITRRATP
jgi:hypothetical protein